MLVLHDPSNYSNLIPLVLDDDAWYVTHAYNGLDTCTFEVPTKSKYRKYIQEEAKVEFIGGRGGNNRFIIKNVDEHSGFVTVDCDIDLDEWKQKIFPSFRETYASLEDILEIITPDGWTYTGQEQFSKSTTIEGNNEEPLEAVTPLAILDECTTAYGVVFNFDTVNRQLQCIKTDSFTASGDFLMEGLNLKSLGFVGNSSNFATRLYAYGVKDEETGEPLTFASINGGKEYVEDVSYCDKVVCVGWSDERYTTQQGLLEAAKDKLADLSKPTRSFECEGSRITNGIWMYKVVTLIDSVRNVRVNHQIVEWKECPNKNDDTVTLSAVAPTMESLLKDAMNTDDKINEAFDNAMNAYDQAIKDATDKITGSYGGYFHWVFDADGNPMELVNTGDSEDINSAKRVWRWNKEGLGHSNNGYNGSYGLALLADGSINASMMTVGIIQGGQSHWNLNTGDLSLVGTFNTVADSAIDASDEVYGVEISPEFSQTETSGTDLIYGSGIQFKGRNRYQQPYVAVEMNTKEEGKISTVVMNGGRVLENDPGSWFRLGVRNNGTASSQKPLGIAMMSAYSRYNDPSKYYALFSARAGGLGSNGKPSGYEVSVNAYAVNSGGSIGMRALGVDTNGTDDDRLLLGGVIGALNGLCPLIYHYYENSSIGPWAILTYNVTLSAPARKYRYKPIATIDMIQSSSSMKFMTVTVANAGASGWQMFVLTMPFAVAGRTSDGASQTYFKTFRAGTTSFYLNSMAILVS